MIRRILIIAVAALAAGAFLYWLHRQAPANATPAGANSAPHTTAAHTNNVIPLDSAASNPAQATPQSRAASSGGRSAESDAIVAPGPVEASIRPALAATAPEFKDLPPATVLENVRTSVRSYGSMFGGNPVGTNPEITKALHGGNPKQVDFIKPEAGVRINANGELVDPWGTPLFFHQLSGTETEIRSAGPDRVMWTSDDLVTR